ncbi:MAG: formate dehydrogenase subunit alpha, partial [Pseudomonadota bacterium]|nr:formate dehydrogenase subunit alpha [Pseudomonadota bacterium]
MTILKEKDFGTPIVESEKNVTGYIDDIEVTVPEGTSIMRAASMLDIDIPSLCASDNIDHFGSCRLCIVDFEGRSGFGYPSSCTTPLTEGMKVVTKNSQLSNLRKDLLEMYISDHPLDCNSCAGNGDCDLQDQAEGHDLFANNQLTPSKYSLEKGSNHLGSDVDESNPYFNFDPDKCIVCSRCVRACNEVQGTFALSIESRGFESKVKPGISDNFFDSECVSCGACVQACPTGSLIEKSIEEKGMPNKTVLTTCAYCGVGCSFKAEIKDKEVVRMVPYKGGSANKGHSCIKGRFAWGYANHQDRIKSPMIRESIDQPWEEVSWDKAINFAAEKFKKIQKDYGVNSIGGITSARTTNEEAYIVQKLVRTAFLNNNVDTCARVCHSPTGYGLKQTFGTSAGTQHFDSVQKCDVIMVIGANPTVGHPVFASQMKKRIRQGAKLIVVDPRKTDIVESPHIKADYHLPILPGSNVPLINAFSHFIVNEGLIDLDYIKDRCDQSSFEDWLEFIKDESNSPEAAEAPTGVNAEVIKKAAHLYATGGKSAIYYGLGVTEHSQGSTMVMGMANLAMATGNVGFIGAGVNPLRGQNNVQGSCDMGSFPHELAGYQQITDDKARSVFENKWNVKIQDQPGMRSVNMFDAAVGGEFKGIIVQGEDFVQSEPNTQHIEEAFSSMDCVVIQDLFLTETAKFAHVFFPATSFLEKDGTFTNAERRINRVRPVMEPITGKHEWEITQELAQAMGYEMNFNSSEEIMDEIAELTPTFTGVSFKRLDQLGSIQWPCNENAPEGTPIMHVDEFVRGE